LERPEKYFLGRGGGGGGRRRARHAPGRTKQPRRTGPHLPQPHSKNASRPRHCPRGPSRGPGHPSHAVRGPKTRFRVFSSLVLVQLGEGPQGRPPLPAPRPAFPEGCGPVCGLLQDLWTAPSPGRSSSRSSLSSGRGKSSAALCGSSGLPYFLGRVQICAGVRPYYHRVCPDPMRGRAG
jgi:hypothetical protein